MSIRKTELSGLSGKCTSLTQRQKVVNLVTKFATVGSHTRQPIPKVKSVTTTTDGSSHNQTH